MTPERRRAIEERERGRPQAAEICELLEALDEAMARAEKAEALFRACDTLTNAGCSLRVESRDERHAWERESDESFAAAIVGIAEDMEAELAAPTLAEEQR